mgnify:CR=1 FL=1
MAASSLPKDPAVASAMATLVFSRMSSRSLPALQRPEHFEARCWVQHTHSPRAEKFKAARERNGFLGSTVLIKPGTGADTGGAEVSEPPSSLANEQQPYKRPPKVEAPKLQLSRTCSQDGGVQLPALATSGSGIRANYVTQPMSMRTPWDARDDERVALESVSKAEETGAMVDQGASAAHGAAQQLSALSHPTSTRYPTRDDAGVDGGVPDPQAPAGPVHGSVSGPVPVTSRGALVLSEEAERFDREVARHHQVLQAKVKTRFGELRRAFRMIDQDFSGACDRGER